jgi:hypothetical protein
VLNIAALRGWTLDELKIYLEGELPTRELSVQKIMADLRLLPLEAVAQIAAAAVETLANRSLSNQSPRTSIHKVEEQEAALSA